jgi:hypothetical protein
MKRTLIFLFLGIVALLWGSVETINGSRVLKGYWDASDSFWTIPAKVGTTAPATCTVGEQFFDSDAEAGSNLMLCTAANTWTAVTSGGGGGIELSDVPCLPGDARWVCAAEEFVSGGTTSLQIGALGWFNSNATVSLQTGARPYYGVLRVASGATSGNNGVVSLSPTGSQIFGNIYTDTTKIWEEKKIFRLGQSADITFRIAFGVWASNGLSVSRGIGLRPVTGNFEVVWGAGGEQASVSTGVALDTAWHTFRVYTDGTNKKVYAQLDSGTPITACVSGCDLTIADGSSFWTDAANGHPWFYVQTDSTGAKHIDVDYWSFKGQFGASAGVR